MSTDLNLRQSARDVVERATNVDLPSLADALLAELTPDQYRDALAQALPTFMRDVVGSLRQTGSVHPPKTTPGLPASWKVQAIRDGWQRRLSEIYATSEGNKRLGDFTHDDLIHQADLLAEQAKQKFAKAKGWRALADVLDEHGAAHVRDLPAEVLMVTLGAVA